jgi:alkanesulfonate monooxygenase SsuD/methylene tetrahydromethanopterin reductase-like flavin-dependent oxidoreductase (luciferase family)
MVKGMTDQYRAELAQHRGGPTDLNPHVKEPMMGAIRHAYVAAYERDIDAIAAPAYKIYYDNITKLWRDFRTLPAYGFTPDINLATKGEGAIVGTPSQVRDQVGRFFEDSGGNYLVLSFAWGGLSQDESMRSLERFVTRVMPDFIGTPTQAAAAD